MHTNITNSSEEQGRGAWTGAEAQNAQAFGATCKGDCWWLTQTLAGDPKSMILQI